MSLFLLPLGGGDEAAGGNSAERTRLLAANGTPFGDALTFTDEGLRITADIPPTIAAVSGSQSVGGVGAGLWWPIGDMAACPQLDCNLSFEEMTGSGSAIGYWLIFFGFAFYSGEVPDFSAVGGSGGAENLLCSAFRSDSSVLQGGRTFGLVENQTILNTSTQNNLTRRISAQYGFFRDGVDWPNGEPKLRGVTLQTWSHGQQLSGTPSPNPFEIPSTSRVAAFLKVARSRTGRTGNTPFRASATVALKPEGVLF
ncbi:MAG: hypothetical protein AAFV53_23295 [Myxococcota bacterium]